MYPYLRVIGAVLSARRMPPLEPGDVHVIRTRCWPWDIDPFGELNNGRSLTLMDIGRISTLTRSNLLPAAKKMGWFATMAGSCVQYRKRVLPFADIEYLECTHHVVHFHLASGEDVPSLSVRVPFAQVAQPLLADERFVQLHRSYVVNLAAVSQLAAGEFWMQSGARVPVPRGREPAARTALKDYLEKQFR